MTWPRTTTISVAVKTSWMLSSNKRLIKTRNDVVQTPLCSALSPILVERRMESAIRVLLVSTVIIWTMPTTKMTRWIIGKPLVRARGMLAVRSLRLREYLFTA